MNNGKFVCYNGEILNASQPVFNSNRAFRFGDGLFESIRLINGFPYNLKGHYGRMMDGAKLLGIEVPEFFTLTYLDDQIRSLARENNLEAGGKARVSLFRSGGGTYFPEKNDASFFIELTYLSDNFFKLNEKGLLIDAYSDIKKSSDILANYKTANSLLYVMAAKFSKENELDDCFLLNQKGKVIESISSNVFLVSNGVLYTPPLEDGCIGGTMRMNVINLALENKITVYESSLSPQNILAADELFLTNAIKGIQWVGGYKSKRYYNNIAKRLLTLINEKETNLKLDLRES